MALTSELELYIEAHHSVGSVDMMSRTCRVIAHRGWSVKAPENTMAAFDAAIDIDVDGIELDVQLTKDGHVVVCHDESLGRTTDGSGPVAGHTLDELKRLDAGMWFSREYAGERIPTLKEVLEGIRNRGWSGLLNVELKTAKVSYPGLERAVVRLLEEYDAVETALISSFNHQSLVRVKEIRPDLRTGILYSHPLYHPWEYAPVVGCDALHPPFSGVDPEMVTASHEAGLEVNAWTADDPENVRRLGAIGVDGIITNRPNQVREWLEKPV